MSSSTPPSSRLGDPLADLLDALSPPDIPSGVAVISRCRRGILPRLAGGAVPFRTPDAARCAYCPDPATGAGRGDRPMAFLSGRRAVSVCHGGECRLTEMGASRCARRPLILKVGARAPVAHPCRTSSSLSGLAVSRPSFIPTRRASGCDAASILADRGRWLGGFRPVVRVGRRRTGGPTEDVAAAAADRAWSTTTSPAATFPAGTSTSVRSVTTRCCRRSARAVISRRCGRFSLGRPRTTRFSRATAAGYVARVRREIEVGGQEAQHRRHVSLPRFLEGRRLCGRRGLRGRGDGAGRQGPQRLLPDPPAGAPRQRGAGDGLLHLQQRGHRRPARPTQTRRRQGADRRLGRASRQRHAEHLLRRRLGLLLQHAPEPLVSVDGHEGRDRPRQRAGDDAQLPDVPRRRPEGVLRGASSTAWPRRRTTSSRNW